MEISCSKDLLNCISWFCSLSSESSVESKLVQRYGQDLREIFKLSKPAVEDILLPDSALDESLMSKLQELSILADEARILIEGWQEMTSKVYYVLRIESAISNIKALLQDIFSSPSHVLDQKTCTDFVEKMRHVTCQSISDIIKDAIQELIENMIPRSDLTEKIADLLTLSSNEELLMEIVALDNLKTNISPGENHGEVKYIDRIIALVNYMHDCYVDKYQLHSINNKPIPSDFCCPLSLELMVDPVIVASGQTYERASIKKWLEQGFIVCPKTRQILSHTNLIPNYTVKALIANWCETYNIKRPDSAKSPHLIMKDPGTSNSGTPAKPGESNVILKNINTNLLPLNGHPREAHLSEAISSTLVVNESGTPVDIPSVTSTDSDASNSEKHHVDYGLGATTVESANHLPIGDADVVTRVPSDLTQYSTDVSGELTQEAHPSSSQREPEFTLRSVDAISTGNNLRRRPSDRFGLRIISSSIDSRHDLSGLETQVRKLVEELKSDSIDAQRTATIELRQLAKHSTENRIVIANCEAIPQLVRLVPSEDPETQENAVTTLLNLSINDNNKMAIANADAIDPLVHVLETGTAEAKENSAATLFSLSVIEENKAKIGRSGAIIPLVELLGSGTPRGKKDAATALFNLSILHENKARIVQAGAVKHLVELMDPAAGMVDKAVAVLANLATIPEGRSAIGHEGGIPYLVEVVELGSARGKENAAAALVQLCTTNSRFSSMVLQEGAVPPLVALSQSGTARAKEKAQVLLAHFRGQRHGNPGRA